MSQTSLRFPGPEHVTAEERGCREQGKAGSDGSVLGTPFRFSQLLQERKSFTFEIHADATLFVC